ncbi:MAG: LptF/LptG family permease [Ignavibacteria bacterium]|nr:LptF/LptG family permease [Ignavibacteria bacterium]
MKILDRYILRHFIQNFLFGLLCFIIIFVLVDLFENLDKFIDNNVPLSVAVQYYAYFTPEIIKLITPVAMLLASLFTLSRFINYSEFTAMKSSGISIYRYLFSIMLFGIIITGFSIYFNGWIVPETNTEKLSIERNYLKKSQLRSQIQNLHFQDKKNRIIAIGNYDQSLQSCQNTTISVFNPDTLTKLSFRIDAKLMLWDSMKNDWNLLNVHQRKFYGTNSEEIKFINSVLAAEIEELNNLSLTPEIIMKKQIKPEEMNLTEFKLFISQIKESGFSTSKNEVDYYSIISFPFANLVTIIFGVSISSNRKRGGAAMQFGISLMVSFIYLGFVKISQTFGYNGDINPVLTAWLANIIFFIISSVNFFRLHRY